MHRIGFSHTSMDALAGENPMAMESPPEFTRVNTQDNKVHIRLFWHPQFLKFSGQRLRGKCYFPWTSHGANILDDIDNHLYLLINQPRRATKNQTHQSTYNAITHPQPYTKLTAISFTVVTARPNVVHAPVTSEVSTN